MKFGKAVSILLASGVGANAASVEWEFPPTETAEFVHGLCVQGASAASATITDQDVSYVQYPQPFGNGVQLWANDAAVSSGVSGTTVCEGGIYLQPSHHLNIDQGSISTIVATAGDPHRSVTICAIAEHAEEPAYNPRVDGTCDGGKKGNGLCPGGCCSLWGWCGWSSPWCGTHGTCGNGNRGNGICKDQTACCSNDGYCGKTQQHCTGNAPPVQRRLLEGSDESLGVTPIEEIEAMLPEPHGRNLSHVEGSEGLGVTPFEMALPDERNLQQRAGGWEDALPHDGFTVSQPIGYGNPGDTHTAEMKVYCKEFPPACPQPSGYVVCSTLFELNTCTLNDNEGTRCTYGNLCLATHAGLTADQCTSDRTLITTAPPKPTPASYGDPHFITWGGEAYDFHGGCDLVLVENAEFSNGLGLNVHIRTSIKTWWSHIKSAAVQIGEHTLEITAGTGSSSYRINGGDQMELQTGDATLGDFPVHFRRVNNHHTIARIDLGNGDAIGVETFKDFVRVNIKDKSQKAFQGSVGLLGAYEDGGKVGRDGKTVFENTDEFGQEWMVRATDTHLFHDVDASQLPLVCPMPDETKKEARRRLGNGSISEEDAALACARVSEGIHRDACVFDVLATQDKDMVGSY